MRGGRVLVVAAFALIPAHAFAQLVQSPAEVERRLQALEDQVRMLQAEIEALRAGVAALPIGQATADQPAPASQPPTATEPLAAAPSGGDQPAVTQLPVYGGQTAGRLLNPDIGMIGNFISATGQSRGGSDALAPVPFMTLQESEASFQAIVDPYARADFFLAIGEEGIEVEEGFVTFPTIPGGLLVKAGKFRANFGRLNAFRNHTLPWVDRPLVMYNLAGWRNRRPGHWHQRRRRVGEPARSGRQSVRGSDGGNLSRRFGDVISFDPAARLQCRRTTQSLQGYQ